MIKKVTITKVFKNDKNKDGIAYVFKKGKNEGKPFTRISIGTDQTGDDLWSTCVVNSDRALQLEVGQEVVLKLTEENGYKNFNFPNKGELQVFEEMSK